MTCRPCFSNSRTALCSKLRRCLWRKKALICQLNRFHNSVRRSAALSEKVKTNKWNNYLTNWCWINKRFLSLLKLCIRLCKKPDNSCKNNCNKVKLRCDKDKNKIWIKPNNSCETSYSKVRIRCEKPNKIPWMKPNNLYKTSCSKVRCRCKKPNKKIWMKPNNLSKTSCSQVKFRWEKDMKKQLKKLSKWLNIN